MTAGVTPKEVKPGEEVTISGKLHPVPGSSASHEGANVFLLGVDKSVLLQDGDNGNPVDELTVSKCWDSCRLIMFDTGVILHLPYYHNALQC